MENKKDNGYLCGDCLYWVPYPLCRYLGICDESRSHYYQMPRILDLPVCDHFTPRPKELDYLLKSEVEFLWCEECKEYFNRAFINSHLTHLIRQKVAHTDAEFNAESTQAAD